MWIECPECGERVWIGQRPLASCIKFGRCSHCRIDWGVEVTIKVEVGRISRVELTEGAHRWPSQ